MNSGIKRPRSEQVIINLLTSGIAWGWPVLLNLALTPLLVKLLGADAYGIRGLIISIIGYFALLDMGVNGAGTKFLAEYHAKGDKPLIQELLGTTLTTYLIAGVVGGMAVWLLAAWFSTSVFKIPEQLQSQSIWAFRIAGIGFTISMITWWGSAIPTGLQRFDVFNGISIGFGTITLLTNLLAAWLGYGIIGIVVANVFSNILAMSAYFFAANKLLPEIKIKLSFDAPMFRRTIMFGIYMVLFRIFSIIFSQLDKTLIGIWIGTSALTFYLVPQSVAQIVHDVNAKLMQFIFPMASEFSASKEHNKLLQLFYRGANLSLVIGAGIAIPIIACASPLLSLWMSPEFAQKSTTVLMLLAATFFLSGLTAMPTSLLGGLGYPQIIPIGAMISGVVGTGLYLFLIKPFGINGAALAKLISIFITVVFYLIACKYIMKISIFRFFKIALPPIGIAILMGIYFFTTATPFIKHFWQLLAFGSFASLLYYSICWVVGVFDNNEKQTLLAFLRKRI
jgi:O-antigen/teichoic acid export membrane protein